MHNVVILPGFDEVDELNRRLGAMGGNLKSDGRPILGLDSRDLLEICLEVCADVLFIPAHIWTPHFAALGASSGFDSLEECYEQLLPHIPAVESGLSSDPPMNRRLSALDRFSVVSNSDAHSPRKLAREATCFDTELSYAGILSALRDCDPQRFTGTIEFYPEEGKYHYDGHRKCGVCWTPEQTLAAEGLCPECGRKLVVGVLHRVEKLADRAVGAEPDSGQSFEYLIPLEEVISSCIGVGPGSKKVQGIYHALVAALGPELFVLREASVEDIGRCGPSVVAEGIRRMRSGNVHIDPGYDGEFGKIQVFTIEECKELEGQSRLFEMPAVPPAGQRPASTAEANGAAALSEDDFKAADTVREMVTDPQQARRAEGLVRAGETLAKRPRSGFSDAPASIDALDPEQRSAVEASDSGPVIVIAGPGSGKTRTLTCRIAHLIQSRGVDPGRIAAITFTNRAAGELEQRLGTLLPQGSLTEAGIRVGTFHRLALDLERALRGCQLPTVVDQRDAQEMLAAAMKMEGMSRRAADTLEAISRLKAAGIGEDDVADDEADGIQLKAAYAAYQSRLRAFGARDFDDILLDLMRLLEAEEEALKAVRSWIGYLLVDEFQDVNAVQYRLVQLLAGDGAGLFVIGDPDQAIYGFRGADAGHFDRLRDDFSGTTCIRLTGNYRSEPQLVCAAAAAIAPHHPKETGGPEDAGSGDAVPASSGWHEGPRVKLVTVASELAEGIAVVQEIGRMVGGTDRLDTDGSAHEADEGHYAFGDFGVLFRTGRQAEVLEECFAKEGLPYRLRGQRSFLETASVRQALAFCRYVIEPEGRWRLLSAVGPGPFQISSEGAQLLAGHLAEAGTTTDPGRLTSGLSLEDAGRLGALLEAARSYRSMAGRADLLLKRWKSEFNPSDDTAFDQLQAIASSSDTLEGMMAALLLGHETDVELDGPTARAETEAVQLMTAHAAKGLEFPVVFICGAEDGLLPLREEGRGRSDQREERRVFCVALTRAREQVVLLRARSRMRYGKRLSPDLSPFVSDIPGELIEKTEAGLARMDRASQLSLF